MTTESVAREPDARMSYPTVIYDAVAMPQPRVELEPLEDPVVADEVPADAAQIVSPAPLIVPAWGRRYARRLAVVDTCAVLVGAVGVQTIHLGELTTAVARRPLTPTFLGFTVLLSVTWLLALMWGGTRDTRVIGHGLDEYKRTTNSTLALYGAVAVISYLLQLPLPRSYLLVMMPTGLLSLLAGRYLSRRWLQRRRLQGHYLTKVVVVGTVRTVRDLIADLRRAPHAGFRVIGVCVESHSSAVDEDGVSRIDGVPILAGLDDVAAVAQRHGAHTVAVTATDAYGPLAVRRLSWDLEKTGAALVLAPALTNIAGPRIHTQPVAGLPLIHVDRPTYQGANRMMKKSFDTVGAMVLLLLTSPLFLLVAIGVKATSAGPVFFRQERVGVNGRAFGMIKFRSMVADAESLLPEMRDQQNAGNEILFKSRNDTRITKIGRVLRRFSVDELPQLINVVRGQMSLVGPRPPLRAEVERYEEDAMLRLLVKPGMTGLWQVSGRSDLSWEDSVRLDVYYIENWSIAGDLAILWRTARAVVSSSGAY